MYPMGWNWRSCTTVTAFPNKISAIAPHVPNESRSVKSARSTRATPIGASDLITVRTGSEMYLNARALVNMKNVKNVHGRIICRNSSLFSNGCEVLAA